MHAVATVPILILPDVFGGTALPSALATGAPSRAEPSMQVEDVGRKIGRQ